MLTLHARHDDHHVSTLRLSGVRSHMLEPAAALGSAAAPAPMGHARLVGLPQAQDAAVALDWEA